MEDTQHQIKLLQTQIELANAAVTKAVRERRAVAKTSPLIADLDAAVEAARTALIEVEVKLRAIYENRDKDSGKHG